MSIADRIQDLRKTKGISQEDLADAAGVSRQAVSKWESEQSIPDIDKVIILSDFFGVTTDYILKGIETTKQAAEQGANASVFVIAATVFNFIGLIVSSAVWYEKQVSMAIVIGLVFMALGCMIFGIGLTGEVKNKEKAKQTFWTINIWLLALLPLSFVYNVLFSHATAPYPLVGSPPVLFPVFWLVYITACLGVIFVQVKTRRRK